MNINTSCQKIKKPEEKKFLKIIRQKISSFSFKTERFVGCATPTCPNVFRTKKKEILCPRCKAKADEQIFF